MDSSCIFLKVDVELERDLNWAWDVMKKNLILSLYPARWLSMDESLNLLKSFWGESIIADYS